MSFSLLMRERERPPYKGPKRAVLRGERSTGQLHASQDTALLHPRLLPPRCPLLPPSHLQVSVPFSPHHSDRLQPSTLAVRTGPLVTLSFFLILAGSPTYWNTEMTEYVV